MTLTLISIAQPASGADCCPCLGPGTPRLRKDLAEFLASRDCRDGTRPPRLLSFYWRTPCPARFQDDATWIMAAGMCTAIPSPFSPFIVLYETDSLSSRSTSVRLRACSAAAALATPDPRRGPTRPWQVSPETDKTDSAAQQIPAGLLPSGLPAAWSREARPRETTPDPGSQAGRPSNQPKSPAMACSHTNAPQKSALHRNAPRGNRRQGKRRPESRRPERRPRG